MKLINRLQIIIELNVVFLKLASTVTHSADVDGVSAPFLAPTSF